MYWPGEDATTIVLEELMVEVNGLQVGDECTVRHTRHKGKVAALGMLLLYSYSAHVHAHVRCRHWVVSLDIHVRLLDCTMHEQLRNYCMCRF